MYSLCLRFRLRFESESERPNGNSVTKQSPNYHLAVSENSDEWPNAIQPFDSLYPNLMNGNSATALWLNCHSAFQTQTQMQTALSKSMKNVRLRCRSGILVDNLSDIALPHICACFHDCTGDLVQQVVLSSDSTIILNTIVDVAVMVVFVVLMVRWSVANPGFPRRGTANS